MEEIYLIYKTDTWHSYASRDILGVATDPQMVFSIIEEQVKKEGETLSDDGNFELRTYSQTQSYSGEGEFQFETIQTNVLL